MEIYGTTQLEMRQIQGFLINFKFLTDIHYSLLFTHVNDKNEPKAKKVTFSTLRIKHRKILTIKEG